MKGYRYTTILALLLAFTIAGGATKAKAQELSSDEIYERATYIIVQQDMEKRREYDTLRWQHNLRLEVGTPSAILSAVLDSDIISDGASIATPTTASDDLARYRYYTTPTIMIPPISFEYNYYVKRWLTVGGKAIFSGLHNEVRHIRTEELLYSNNTLVVGLMLNLRFEYMRREYVQLYSAVGAGLAARFEYERGVMIPMYDLTYFGIAVGKDFYGFAEVGGGLSGFARAGLGFRF